MENIDIRRVARAVMAIMAEGARDHATQRIAELTNAGDLNGAAIWSDIRDAITQMSH